ncbi:MAG: OmpA family protein [Thiohalomonadaceae bacterium]
MKIPSLWLALALTAFLGAAGCATQPKDNARIEQAEDELNMLKQDTAVQAYGASALLDAEEALKRAERAHEKGDRSARDHQIYLAQRHMEIARVSAQRGQTDEEVSRLAEERDRLALESRERELAARQSELEEAQERTRELEAELAALEARRTARGLMLTLDDVFFQTASANIAPGATSTIDKVAEVLEDKPDQRIVIEGHTDSVGTASYNQRLSELRAQAVKDLIVARGIDAERIAIYGYGESRPVASNENAAGRQLNRRVEIVFPDTAQ